MQEEEKTERQLEKLAEQFPALSRPRSHTATSGLPPITAVMATQTTMQPVHTTDVEKGTSSAIKGGGLQEMHHGSVGQGSPIEHLGRGMEMTEMEMVEMEEEVEEEAEEAHHLLPEEIQKSEIMEQS